MKYFATRLSDNMMETPEGFLLCPGVPIAKAGEQEYMAAETPLKAKNGKVIIIRKAEEVFSDKTIASFEGKCFTILHPDEFVNTENFQELSKGHMQNVRRGTGEFSDDLLADVLIKDEEAILLVKEGMRGLSCGYEAEYIQLEDGVGEQRNIIGNHLALVEEGRAGEKYKISDNKGVSLMKLTKTLAEKLKSTFTKTIDEAVEAESKEETKEVTTDETKQSLDALMKQCDEMMKLVKGMTQNKEAGDEKEVKEVIEKKEESKDEEVSPGLEARLKALEEKLDKVLAAESAEAQIITGDEDEDQEDEVIDEDVITDKVGDSASRAEILAPGIDIKAKDLKVRALKEVYKTTDGKKYIDIMTGGKPQFDNKDQVELLFNATSEYLKTTREDALARNHQARVKDHFKSTIFDSEKTMTAEKMNEKNAKHYGSK